MKKKRYPTCWSQWFGKFAIKVNGESTPEVVYINGVSKFGLLKGKILNSPMVFLAKPSQLVEYTPRIFTQLLSNQKYNEHLRQVGIWKKRAINGKL